MICLENTFLIRHTYDLVPIAESLMVVSFTLHQGLRFKLSLYPPMAASRFEDSNRRTIRFC
jgi:hypothetical protein